VADLPAPAPQLQRLAEAPEVTDLRWPSPLRLELSLTGRPGPVLRALADADVARVEVREPSLEEIFLDYYGAVPA
jgi:ABC-2 type transport system ATP-binding protein